MSAALALLLAAAGVGIGHAVLPDHWVPLAVLSRAQRYPLRRTLRLSAAAGVAHVLLSLLLGAIVIAVGLRFRGVIEHNEALVVGGLLALTGAIYLVVELLGKGHRHPHPADHPQEHGHGHGHGHEHGHGHGEATAVGQRRTKLLAIVLPFGAAASPDLTILPVFLAASAVGVAAAVGAILVFALATLGTIISLTVLAAGSAARLRGALIDRYAGPVTALVLLVIGLLVAFNLM
jgi:ABC-type nickel/cobalt efflux system permease component RcnA